MKAQFDYQLKKALINARRNIDEIDSLYFFGMEGNYTIKICDKDINACEIEVQEYEIHSVCGFLLEADQKIIEKAIKGICQCEDTGEEEVWQCMAMA